MLQHRSRPAPQAHAIGICRDLSKIAYLTSEYPALSHTFIRREIAALREKGFDIQPFSVRPGKPVWKDDAPSILGPGMMRVMGSALAAVLTNPLASVRSFILSQRHRELGLRGWVWSLFHLAEALALSRMLRKASVTRLHSHFANSGATVGMIAAHHLGIPWSLTLHGISETDPPAGGLLADKVRRAEFVACASWFMRAQAMRMVEPAHWGKLHIVRCGVNLRPAGQANLPVRRLVTVGRLSAEKGYPGLLDALRMVRSKVPGLTLNVVGDGPLRQDFESGLEAAGLTQVVTLHGGLPEEEALALIASADAFVLSSLMEGLPVVLMEAMAAGKPVIAPAVAGIPELVRDGETGLLFRPGDWVHLAQQIERLAGDQRLASTLAKAGRVRVEEEFVIDDAVAPLANLLGG